MTRRMLSLMHRKKPLADNTEKNACPTNVYPKTADSFEPAAFLFCIRDYSGNDLGIPLQVLHHLCCGFPTTIP